jgi:hypothetical protein
MKSFWFFLGELSPTTTMEQEWERPKEEPLLLDVEVWNSQI